MEYHNITIKELILERLGRTTFLPAIQREYVWDTGQVEKLFDSILCGYPISSFLFWKIRNERAKDWVTYDFIKNFDQQNPHNENANLNGRDEIYLVLDGQQRITSLNIALCGSYKYLRYGKERKTKLYLNLLWNKENDNPDEMSYQFLFKVDDKAIPNTDYPQFWYEVGDILNHADAEDAKDKLYEKLEPYPAGLRRNALMMIGKLHQAICKDTIINYYEEKSEDYDKVLEIFIRTNTGGQKLEYSDILLSTATAKWKNLNAREEINSFTDEINDIGKDYGFGKDFVMKAAMYLTAGLPIKYKVSSFTGENLDRMEENWPNVKRALRDSVELVHKFGFTKKNLVAHLVLLPVAQYLLNKPTAYLRSTADEAVKDRINIHNWIILMLLKGVLGSSTDTRLATIRPIVKPGLNAFPCKDICDALKMDTSFSDIEITNFLSYQYGSRYSYLILSLLYPNRSWEDKYDEDHIFPKTEFTKIKLAKRGYSVSVIDAYLNNYNTLLNLELLEGSENKSKSDDSFDEWIKNRTDDFKKRHHIPVMSDYSMNNFLTFIDERRKLLVACLKGFRLE